MKHLTTLLLIFVTVQSTRAPAQISKLNWKPIASIGSPTPREYHTAVWTGTEMIIWGGSESDGNLLNTGAAYNPSTEKWRAISTLNAPKERNLHMAVWTGSKMIIWGGCFAFAGPCVFGNVIADDGGIYDPQSDTWTSLSANAPEGRAQGYAFWTGSKLMVFDGWEGGETHFAGAMIYDPNLGTWNKSSAEVGGSPIIPRRGSASVFANGMLLSWGGIDDIFPDKKRGAVRDGLIYQLQSDGWSKLTSDGAPQAPFEGCFRPSATWTGKEMVVFGGAPDPRSDGGCNTGGLFNPATGRWRQTPLIGAPSKRSANSIVAIGDEVVIWGGMFLTFGEGQSLSDGFVLNSTTNSWRPLPQTQMPEGRSEHSSVWTGSQLLVWGGSKSVGEVWQVLGNGAVGSFEE